MEQSECTPETLPSVEEVYPLAIASYDTAIKRFDAVDSKINTLVTFAVSVSLVLPVIANTKGLSFRSYWFAVAVVVFIGGIGVATYARMRGELLLLDPRVLYDSYLDLEPWQFKRHTIDWAGNNWRHNQNLINRNGRLAALAASFFALEVLAVGGWVLAAL